MKYHAPTNQFTISADELQRASHAMRWAIKHIRMAGGLDTKGGEIPGPLGDAEFAEVGILDAAKYIGIDLGSGIAGELDVSNE